MSRFAFALSFVLVACSSKSSTPSTVVTPATFAITSSISAMTGILNAQNASRASAGVETGDAGTPPSADAGSEKFEGMFTGPDQSGCWNGVWTDADQTSYAVKLCPTPRWDQAVEIDDAGIATVFVATTGTLDGPVRAGSFAVEQTLRSVVPPEPDGSTIFIEEDGGLPDLDGGLPPPPDAAVENINADSWSVSDGGGVMTDKSTGWTLRFTQSGSQQATYDGGTLSIAQTIRFVGVIDAGQELSLTGSVSGVLETVSGVAGSLTVLITGEFREQSAITARIRIEALSVISSNPSSTPAMTGHYTVIDDNFATERPLSEDQILAIVEKLLTLPL